jgi:hypothetical protein
LKGHLLQKRDFLVCPFLEQHLVLAWDELLEGVFLLELQEYLQVYAVLMVVGIGPL